MDDAAAASSSKQRKKAARQAAGSEHRSREDELQAVAAFFGLSYPDVLAVADGLLPIEGAAQKRLAAIRAEIEATKRSAKAARHAAAAEAAAAAAAAATAKKRSTSPGRKVVGADEAMMAAVDAKVGAALGKRGSGGGGGEGDDNADEDELVASLMDEMAVDGVNITVDPERAREAEIMEEVARRRSKKAASSAKVLRKKSDDIFNRFDVDFDGYMNYKELKALGKATGGELPEIAYGAICEEIGADPAKGVTSDQLWRLYSESEMGDVSRDYNIVFRQ